MPVQLTSIFVKSAMEKNDGSLQISFVASLNSDIHENVNSIKTTVHIFFYICILYFAGVWIDNKTNSNEILKVFMHGATEQTSCIN